MRAVVDGFLDLIRTTEGIARALHDQRRHGEGFEMRDAVARSLTPWRREWIAEGNHTVRARRLRPFIQLRTKMRGDAATHRLAADEQLPGAHVPMLDGTKHGPPKRLLEHRCTIRGLAPLLHIGEVERHHGDAAVGEPFRIAGHERMKLPGAGAVREHKKSIEIAIRSEER